MIHEKQFDSICKEIDSFFKITLSDKQLTKLKHWLIEKRNQKIESATIGGRWTFELTPTGLGECFTVRDNANGESIDLTDTENW